MFNGLSRTTLNIIIFVCLLAITWLHLGSRDPEEQPLDDLLLPELTEAGWEYHGQTGQVPVWLRPGGTAAGGLLAIRSSQGLRTLSLPAADWLKAVQQQQATLPDNVPAVLLISGPWPLAEQALLAAWLIGEQRLQPLPGTDIHWPSCVREHPAGALWLGQQYGLDWTTLAALPGTLASSPAPDLPTRQAWEQWRLEQSRSMRRHWQDEQGQIDIQAAVAYHRLPADTYRQLYQTLGSSQKTAVAALLDCLQPSP